MTCAECNGRGWLKDGSSHGALCMACASPEVLKAVNAVKRAPARSPLKQDADHKKPRAALKKAAKTRTLGDTDAQVASAVRVDEDLRKFSACRVDGCSKTLYRYGHCYGHYLAICRAKKRAADQSSTARST